MDWDAAWEAMREPDEDEQRAQERAYHERRQAQEAAAWAEVEAELAWADECPAEPWLYEGGDE